MLRHSERSKLQIAIEFIIKRSSKGCHQQPQKRCAPLWSLCDYSEPCFIGSSKSRRKHLSHVIFVSCNLQLQMKSSLFEHIMSISSHFVRILCRMSNSSKFDSQLSGSAKSRFKTGSAKELGAGTYGTVYSGFDNRCALTSPSHVSNLSYHSRTLLGNQFMTPDPSRLRRCRCH